MAATFLRVIPADPKRVPSATARAAAEGVLRRALPAAEDVTGTLTDAVRFIDCGDNFESVACPRCAVDIGAWWSLAMEIGQEQGFCDLQITTACCGTRTSLNDLVYAWPVGFARFSLEALNPGVGSLPANAVRRLEDLLGGPVRLIWGHM